MRKSKNEEEYFPEDELGFFDSGVAAEAPFQKHYVPKLNSRIRRKRIGFKQNRRDAE